MKTAYDLLETAPEGQVIRMRLVFAAIANGRWQDAAHYLRNAYRETCGQWSEDARKLCRYCESHINRVTI